METLPAAPTQNGTKGALEGRDPQSGRFVKGYAGGPGADVGKQTKFRNAMLAAITEDDVREVIHTLVTAAKAGEGWAIKEFLDRVCGKPVQPLTNEGDKPLFGSMTFVVALPRQAGSAA